MHTRRRSTQAVRSWNLSPLACWELEGGSFLVDYHRPNVLTDYHETRRIIGRWGGTVSRGKVAVRSISIIWRDTPYGPAWHLSSSASSSPSPRLFAEVNASECRCPREPPRARETPTASHILRMKTFTTILARATPPTPSFPSRGQRPMMSLFLRVPAPSFLSSLFLPYPSLTLFEGILSSFLFSFFFYFHFRTRGWVVSKFLLFLQRRKKGIFGIVEFGTDRNERSLFPLCLFGKDIPFFRFVWFF